MKKQDNRKSDAPGLMKESEHTEHSGHSGFPEVPKDPKKQRMECLKVFQRMRPMDDTFMRKLFLDNQPLVEHLLRIVTGDETLKVAYSQTQRDEMQADGSRSAIIDLYARTEAGSWYGVEVENRKKRATPKRARYLGVLMDRDALQPKDGVESLPEMKVIFITTGRLWDGRQARYDCRRYVDVGNKLQELGDETSVLYVSTSYEGDDALGRLMHDFQCSDPDEMLDEMMAESTRRCKNDRKVVNEMCDIIEEYGNEMMARGEERSLVKSVKTLMLTMHMTVEQAMDALKVPEDRRSSIVQHVQ